jgi:flagellar basal body-associated protein FliL
MYLVPIAWLYVSLMMAVAEATHSNGTVLGALVTFVLYGLLPIGIIVYVMGSKGRRRAAKAREAAQAAAVPLPDPNASGHAATDAVTPVRKEA